MFALVAVVLAAAPVNVIAVHGPKSEQALARLSAQQNVTIVDASALHEYLLRPTGLLPMQDFERFTAAPFKGWPTELETTWKKNVAHCHDLVGEPPWKEVGTAMACANRLSVFLWQQFAAQQKAARVFEVDVSTDERRSKARVAGSVWEPNSRDQLFFDEGGTLAELDQTTGKVLAALIAKKGITQARNVVSELASSFLGDPFAKETKITTAVTFPKTCPALPAQLTVTPAGPLADSIVGRWKPEGARGPAQACTLSFSEHTEDGAGMGPLLIVGTLLTCSSTIVSAEVAKSPFLKRTSADLVSEKLVQGLATKLCK